MANVEETLETLTTETRTSREPKLGLREDVVLQIMKTGGFTR
jgi:hypothetical protein